MADLYADWLTNASFIDQARNLLEQKKDGLAGRAAMLAGKLAVIAAGAVLGNAVRDTFDTVFGIASEINDDLKTAGISITPLQVDEAKSLLQLVDASGPSNQNLPRPLLLILDQWEDTGNIKQEFHLLQTYLREWREWPHGLHIIIHLRKPDKNDETKKQAREAAYELCTSDRADYFSVERIEFEKDLPAQDVLLTYIREYFPFTSEMENIAILELIDGIPGVLGRLAEAMSPPTSEAEFRKLIQLAHAYSYPEIRDFYHQHLPDTTRGETESEILTVALRLAMIPDPPDERVWSAWQDSVLCGASQSVLTALCSIGFLFQKGGVYTIGHPKRQLAARLFALEEDLQAEGDRKIRPYLSAAISTLVHHLTENVADLDDARCQDRIRLLAFLEPDIRILDLPDYLIACSMAANTIIGRRLAEQGMIDFADRVKSARDAGQVTLQGALLLARGLTNAIGHSGPDHDGADRLLAQLRDLQRAYPDDRAVREQLACGLFNAFHHSEGPRATELLDELRDLQRAYPDDRAVRERLASGLTNAIAHSGTDHDRADRLLAELRNLQQEDPDDRAVRERLAKGLTNAIAHSGTDHDGADRLLAELRNLQQEDPDDRAVRELLAKGLFNAFHNSEEPRTTELLDELRDLHRNHPDDTSLGEPLARALGGRVAQLLRSGDQKEARAAYEELTQLNLNHPDNKGIAIHWTEASKLIDELP